MQELNFLTFIFLLIFTFQLTSCKNRTVDKLRPETVTFLTNQEQARCECLDLYGEEFTRKINKGIEYISGLSNQYNMDSLSTNQMHAIKIDLVAYMSIIKTVSSCIAKRTPEIDQFTGMLMQEDLRVVLGIDSTMTEQEQLELMNQPSLELLDEFCPQHKEAVVRLQDLMEAAQVLPVGLR